MRHEIPRLVHNADGGFAVFDADVNVQAEDEIRTRDHLEVLHDVFVALIGIYGLIAPVGERMRGGGGDEEAVFAREPDDGAAQFGDVAARFLDVVADAGADLDHGLVHFRFDVFLEEGFALFDDLELDVRPEVERLRVYGLILFFDPEGEAGTHIGGSGFTIALEAQRHTGKRYLHWRMHSL